MNNEKAVRKIIKKLKRNLSEVRACLEGSVHVNGHVSISVSDCNKVAGQLLEMRDKLESVQIMLQPNIPLKHPEQYGKARSKHQL